MALKQKTVTVGETTYLLNQFPTTKGIGVMKQLMRLCGPSATALFNDNNISKAIELLVANVEAVNAEELMKVLVGSASKGSVAVNFDDEFAGEYANLMLLCKEVVVFNFGNVFQLLGSSAK